MAKAKKQAEKYQIRLGAAWRNRETNEVFQMGCVVCPEEIGMQPEDIAGMRALNHIKDVGPVASGPTPMVEDVTDNVIYLEENNE